MKIKSSHTNSRLCARERGLCYCHHVTTSSERWQFTNFSVNALPHITSKPQLAFSIWIYVCETFVNSSKLFLKLQAPFTRGNIIPMKITALHLVANKPSDVKIQSITCELDYLYAYMTTDFKRPFEILIHNECPRHCVPPQSRSIQWRYPFSEDIHL